MRLALSTVDGRRLSVPVETVSMALLGLFVAVFALDVLGVSLPLVRPVLAFCLLTFVPGALVLTLLGFGPRAELRWGVYVVGVSLLTICAVGLVINLVYPLLGIMRPLSPLPLVVTYGLLISALAVAIRRIDPPREDLSVPLTFELIPMPFALVTLPLLSVLAVEYLDATGGNVPILLVLCAISVLPLAVVVGVIRSRWHALCLWALAIALLYHKSLWWFYEYKGQSNIPLAWKLGRWTPGTASGAATSTSLLPNVMLPPTYAHLAGLGIFTQLEVVNPLLVSLIPICMFVLFRRYVCSRDAFIGACVLAFAHPFYFQLPTAVRAAMPVLFLTLFGVVLTDSELSSLARRSFGLAFTAGFIVSHYGSAYLLMLTTAVAVCLLALFWRLDALSVAAERVVASDGGSTDQQDGSRYKRAAAVVGRVVREHWTRLFAVSLFVGAAFAITTAGEVWVAFHALLVEPLGFGRIPYLGEWLGMPRMFAIVVVATAISAMAFAGTLVYYLRPALTVSEADDWEWRRVADDEHGPDATTASETGDRLLSPTYVVLYAATTLGWYMYTFGGKKLDILFEHIAKALTDLYGGGGGTANRLAKDYGMSSVQLSKYLYVVIAGLMLVGLLAAYHRRFLTDDCSFDDEFLALSTALLGGFGVTFFVAGAWGGGRPMVLTFCITAVFVPVGARALGRTGTTVFSWLRSRFGRGWGVGPPIPPISRSAIAVLLAGLLVVNTGVVAAVALDGAAPSNVPLQQQIITSDNPYLRSEVYRESDLAMYVWLVDYRDPSLPVYGDAITIEQYNDWYNPQIAAYADWPMSYDAIKLKNSLPKLTRPADPPGYAMLGGHNIALGVVVVGGETVPLSTVKPELATRSKIFTTGNSTVYLAEE